MAVFKPGLPVMAVIQWKMPKKLAKMGTDILVHLLSLHIPGQVRNRAHAPILTVLNLPVASDTIYLGIHLDWLRQLGMGDTVSNGSSLFSSVGCNWHCKGEIQL